MHASPEIRRRGWSVLFAALAINLILGVLYAWGVTGKALVGEWHWTKAQAALPFTVSTVSFALTMIFAGRLQDRIGPRYVAMLGGVILGVGLFGSSFARSPEAMLVSFGIIGGLGIGLGYSATTPPAIKWFAPTQKGLVTGTVVSGVGLAAVYMSPLTDYLLRTFGISQTFVFLGMGTIVFVSLLAQLLANPPAGYVAGAPAVRRPVARTTPAARTELDWHEMLRTRHFYLLWLTFVLSASAGLMIIMHIAIIAKEQAHVDRWGFWLVAILALCNTTGRLLSGLLSDRIGRSRTMILAFLLQALNMFVFPHYTSPGLIVFGAAATGLCYGAIFTLFPASTADRYGVSNLGVNYGLLFTAFGVAGVTGPYVGGKLRDIVGSYTLSYTLSAFMLLAGALLALFLQGPGRQTAQRPLSAKVEVPDLVAK